MGEEAPSWRFVHLSDPHLASTRDGEWNNRFLCSMMPEVMRVLGEDLRRLGPDFVLATGDIASTQTREAMFEARDLMDSLGVPYYPMGGNHDFVLPDSREWFLDAFGDRLPERRTHYAFEHKGLHFFVLDAWWLWGDGALSEVSPRHVAAKLDTGLEGARWAVPPEQLAWLDEELVRVAPGPAFVAVHYPALPIPERLRRPDLKDGGQLENGDLLLEILHGHKNARGIFSGHVHMHFVERSGEIVQVATGALPEYPVEYREVCVYPDRLEITTRGLSDASFSARSLIPGREYTAGQAQDRAVVIRL